METSAKNSDKSVVIIGGGHNGLVAACYLAKAGLKVIILEANPDVGGASVSQQVFPEYEARLSRYSYLVALLPDQIVSDLGINFKTLGRSVASFTPTKRGDQDLGLLVNTDLGGDTKEHFAKISGGESEFKAWQDFYSDVAKLADAIAPTMLQKLPTRSELRSKVNHPIWDEIMERPLGEVLEKRFSDDLVRGVVLTDGLIGTFSDAHDLQSNICFLYHLIGNGSGEWKVPYGGMGALIKELTKLALENGATIKTNSKVSKVVKNGEKFTVEVSGTSGSSGSTSSSVSSSEKVTYESDFVLANCAPQVLADIAGISKPESLDGSQIKINMLLEKLPRLKSGIDPKVAFAGTFHIDETYSDLQSAYAQSKAGKIPDRIPAEVYCHTLTDTSILAPDLVARGMHTLTLFGIHLPASLFDKDEASAKAEVKRKLLSQINEYLLDPIEECLAKNSDGSLCIEVKSPLELEKEISLPRGNIFHKDLAMPFREDGTPATWGVETSIPNLFICGAGAIRGGGVSGIPGHNAAAAVLEVINS